jgi:hypothetical protein
MHPKADPVASPSTHAFAVEALDRSLDAYKQILKKQIL